MSQMNNITARNLFEFGDYFKKSLVLGLVVAILSPIIALLLFVIPFGAGFLGLILLGALIAVLVFQIMMLIRLSRAKDSSPHPELVRTFQLMIISIIVSVIAAFGNYIHWMVPTLCNIASTVLTLIAWQSLGKYIAVYSGEANPNEGFPMVAEGVKSYVLFAYISVAISLVELILGFFPNDPYTWDTMDTIAIIMSFVALAIAIGVIVAQFKIANGMKMIFGNTPQYQPNPQQYSAPSPTVSTQEIVSSVPIERYCSKCGAKIVGEAKFCTSCGETLE